MENIFSHIFVLAGIQGILLSILLFTKKVNHTANVLLGFSVLALSIDLFDAVYYLNSFFYENPHLFGLTVATTFLYGPIFYLYVKILSTGRKFRKKDFLHFTPFFLTIAYLTPVLLSGSEEKLLFILKTINDPPLDFQIINYLKTIIGVVYTILVIRAINEHNKNIKDSYSNMDKINLNWFKNLILGMIFLWVIYAAGFVVNIFFDFRYELIIHLSMSILIYSVGYIALKQPEILIQADVKSKLQPESYSGNDQSEKYKKSGLADSSASELLNTLVNLMEKEKPYLDRELTLSKLAEMMDASPHNLSEVINTKLGQNFYDFVNKYRVEEFKKKLEEPEFTNYSLLALAYDSGFNSKTSFNTIFKKFTQVTPSRYRENISQKKAAMEITKEE